MAEWSPLDNPEEVSGKSPEYYLKTQKDLALKQKKELEEKEAKAKAEIERQNAAVLEEKKRKKALDARTVNPAKGIQQFVQAATQTGDIPKPLKGTPLEGPAEFYQEGRRVIQKGFLGVAEGVLNVGTQAVMDLTVNQGKSKDEYLRAAWDFGITPKTELGKAGATIASFLIGTKLAGKALGPAGKLGTSPVPAGLKGMALRGAKAKRLATEGLIPGAVADFILTDPRSGNVSNAVQNLVPEKFRDNFMFALAAKEDDNPWVNRLRSTAEGGPLNAIGNGLVALVFGKKAAQAVKAAGGSDDEALAAGVKAIDDKSDELMKSDEVDNEVERVKWTEANETQMNAALNKDAELNEQLSRLDPEADADEITRIKGEIDDVKSEISDLEAQFFRNADPDDKREYWETQATFRKSDPPSKVVADQILVEEADDGTGRVLRSGGSNYVFTDAQNKINNFDGNFKSIIDEFSSKIDFEDIARRTGKSIEQIKINAERIYNDVADVFKNLDDELSDKEMLKAIANAGGALVDLGSRQTFANVEGAAAVKALIGDFTSKIYDIAYAAEELDYSGIGGINNYDRLIDRFVGLLGIYKESAQYTGSSLQGFKARIKAFFSGERQAIEDIKASDELTYGAVKKWADNIKNLSRKGDPQAQEEFRTLVRAMVLAGGDPAKTMRFSKAAFNIWHKGAEHIFMNNILSGFKTAARNTSGIIRVFLDPAAIALRGKFAGNEAQVKAGLAGLNSIASSLSEAWRVSKITWDSRVSITGTSQQIIEKAELESTIAMMETMAKNPQEELAVGFAKFTMRFGQSPIMDWPGRLLTSTDDFMKTIIARQRIAQMATMDAFNEAPNVSQRAEFLDKYMEKYSKYIDPSTGKILDKGLAVYTEIGTFQDDPGKAINMLSGMVEAVPFAKFLVPFIRTPANLMRYQLEFVPLTHKFSKKYADAVASGDELMVAEIEGRMAIGALVFSSAFLLGTTGRFTGNLPVDPAERKRWNDLGIRPRSFNPYGNVYISYNAIEPLNNIIAAATDIAQWAALFKEDVGGQVLMERFATQMTLAIAASFTEKSYFANFEALASFIDIDNMSPQKIEKMMANFAFSSAVPLSGAVRGFANAFDPYQREYDNEWQRVFQGNTPFLRNMLPPKIDILTGQQMKNPNGNVWNANMPFEVAVKEEDPVKNMLMKARYNWNDKLDTYKGVSLTAEQKNFVRKEMYKAGLRKDLVNLNKQQWFKDDMDEFRNRPFNPNDETTQPRSYIEIGKAFKRAKAVAFARLEAENVDDFASQVREKNITKAQFKAGIYGGSSTTPKVNTQELDEINKKRIETILNF
jgi:hypothetical protein